MAKTKQSGSSSGSRSGGSASQDRPRDEQGRFKEEDGSSGSRGSKQGGQGGGRSKS